MGDASAPVRPLGFSTIGVIRGEEHLPLNSSLSDAVRHGMRLTYLDRTAYRDKERPELAAALHDQFGWPAVGRRWRVGDCW
jgi:1-aminocyclopropane-1-carboxylate deaminase